MFKKWDYYYKLKNNLKEKENVYNKALEQIEITFSRINKGVIHGKKEAGAINSLKAVIGAFQRASYEYELATYQLNSFLKNGEIKYE